MNQQENNTDAPTATDTILGMSSSLFSNVINPEILKRNQEYADKFDTTTFNIDLEIYDKERIQSKHYSNPEGINYNILYNTVETTESGVLVENPCPNYRSVITTEQNKVICVAPPSSMNFENFATFYSKQSAKEIVINEVVEGTMINLFYDERIESWEITTRVFIGCNNWFLKLDYQQSIYPVENGCESNVAEKKPNKTFRDMFFDVIGTSDLNTYFELFNKSYCYSFVLQHPYNIIVLPITVPCLYLISIYEIMNFETDVPERPYHPVVYVNEIPFYGIDPETDTILDLTEESRFVTNDKLEFIDTHIKIHKNIYIPTVIKPPSSRMDEFANQYMSAYDTEMSMDDLQPVFLDYVAGFYPVGIMLTHVKSGSRTLLFNQTYDYLKVLRGNNPNLKYHYFELKQNGKLKEYLYYFPNYLALFTQFEKEYQDFITCVHQTYFEYYIKKTVEKLPKQYFIHASKIHHEIFLKEKRVIRRNVVAEYFAKMTPSQLVFHIR